MPDSRRTVTPNFLADPAATPSPMLDRPRLLEMLDRAGAFAVICAPPGFGKTVLLDQWCSHAAALSSGADSRVVVRVNAHDPSDEMWPERAESLTVVIDDVERLLDTPAGDAILEAMRRKPGLRVIASLSDTAQTLALQAGHAAELITGRQLAFSQVETAQLCASAGLESPSELAEQLHDAIGGWPEPTHSAVLTIRQRPLTRDSIDEAATGAVRLYLNDRLASSKEDSGRLSFALATAIPDTVAAEVAEFATGDPDASSRFAQLRDDGALVESVGSGELAYRWPTAARHALRRQLARHDPQRLRSLHRALSAYYLQQSDVEHALQHAIGTEDWPVVVEVIETHWARFLDGPVGVLDAALRAVPLEAFAEKPRAAAVRDIRLQLRHEPIDVAADLLLRMPAPLPQAGTDLDDLARSEHAYRAFSTASAMMIAFRVRGSTGPALEYAGMVERIAAVARVYRPGDVEKYLPAGLMQAGITSLVGGQLIDAADRLRQAYESAEGAMARYVRSDTAAKLALLHALTGDVVQSRRWLDRHSEAEQAAGWLAPKVALSATLARGLVAIERLERDIATQVVAELEDEVSPEQTWQPFVSYVRAQYDLLWGDRHGALRRLRRDRERYRPWLDELSTAGPLLLSAEADVLLALGLGNEAIDLLDGSSEHPCLATARARVALLTDRPDTALRIVAAELPCPSLTPRWQTELLLVAASARLRLDDVDAATTSFHEAVATARVAGALRPFRTVDAADLERLAARSPAAAELLENEHLRRTAEAFTAPVTVVALTPREQDVLDQIVEGLNMQQIAGALYLSYNTVKSHMRSLYQKLGVSSRDQAIAHARDYGLLPPRPEPSS